MERRDDAIISEMKKMMAGMTRAAKRHGVAAWPQHRCALCAYLAVTYVKEEISANGISVT